MSADNLGQKEFETQRLKLRPQRLVHVEELFNIFQDPNLHTFTRRDVPKDLVEFAEGIRFLEKGESRDGNEWWWNWVGICQSSGKIACQVEISLPKNLENCFIAYYVFPNFKGMGLGQEACTHIARQLYLELGLELITIEMDILNTASWKFAEKLGAKRVNMRGRALFYKERWSDEYTYHWKLGEYFEKDKNS